MCVHCRHWPSQAELTNTAPEERVVPRLVPLQGHTVPLVPVDRSKPRRPARADHRERVQEESEKARRHRPRMGQDVSLPASPRRCGSSSRRIKLTRYRYARPPPPKAVAPPPPPSARSAASASRPKAIHRPSSTTASGSTAPPAPVTGRRRRDPNSRQDPIDLASDDDEVDRAAASSDIEVLGENGRQRNQAGSSTGPKGTVTKNKPNGTKRARTEAGVAEGDDEVIVIDD